MKMNMNRRDFLKYSIGTVATLAVGSRLFGLRVNDALAQTAQTLNVTITEALKDMVTDNPDNPAKCYFWIYRINDITAEIPGPNIIMTKGETVDITITNELDEPHAFVIPGIFNSGPIPPIQDAPNNTFSGTIDTTPAKSGTYLYHDDQNPPVNRVMGLHGAFIVMPAVPSGAKFTPFDVASPGVQDLFDDLGTAPQWPGLAWEQGDPAAASFAPPFRQYIWVVHQASPNLFEQVGSLPAGEIFDATTFVNAFLRDPFSPVNATRTPQYFTIAGQSGHFSHNNPFTCPTLRVGEPCVIRVLNAGLMSHSLHMHANHVFVIGINKVVPGLTDSTGTVINPIWVDTFTSNPMDIWEWLDPFMRAPDVPNFRGIGNPDIPGEADFPLTSLNGQPVWPPNEEIALFIPKEGTKAGDIPIAVQLSPLCYPMHDHSEPSQTSQGGNYNLGLISGMNLTGDRHIKESGVFVVKTFPNAPNVFGPDRTKLLELAAGPLPAGPGGI